MSWFEVDRDGLRQLLEGRNKSFIIRELVQNAWDESGVTRCDVTLEPIKGNRKARLVVEDDAPEGFYDLTPTRSMRTPGSAPLPTSGGASTLGRSRSSPSATARQSPPRRARSSSSQMGNGSMRRPAVTAARSSKRSSR